MLPSLHQPATTGVWALGPHETWRGLSGASLMARQWHHFIGHIHTFQTCLLLSQRFPTWHSSPSPVGLCWWENMQIPKPVGVAACWQHQQHQHA